MELHELKNQLINDYKYRIELHAHTSPASGCSQITPKAMVETYKGIGYDAVAITNHFNYNPDQPSKDDYIDRYLDDFEQTKYYGDQMGLKVYLGTEIRFTDSNNDYIIFGVTKEMLSDIYDLLPYGLQNFRKNYKMPDSVFIQAHPMRNGMDSVDPNLLDAIEVYNMHPVHNSRVGMVAAYAKEQGISIITAGSDFHHPDQNHEGVAALRAKYLPDDTFDLVGLLRSRDYLLEIGRSNIVIP